MYSPYIAMDILSFIYLLIILASVLSRWKKLAKSTRLYALNVAIVLVGLVCDIFSIYFTKTNPRKEVLFTFLTCLLGNATLPVFAYYCLYQANSKDDIVPVWMARGVLIANILSIAVLVEGFFAQTLYQYIDGQLSACPQLYIMYFIEIGSILFIIGVLLSKRKKIVRRDFICMLILVFMPTLGMSIEASTPDIIVSYTMISISVLVQYVLIQSRLISEAEMREALVIEVSRKDVLTGLSNRRAFTEILDSTTAPTTMGVMFFDVNGLKKTNDELGHLAGDNLIKSFASLLRQNLTTPDLFRVSGDEFVAFYRGADKKKIFDEEAARIKEVIDRNNSIASMGVFFTEDMDIVKIINQAETFMYEDKRAYYTKVGRDRRRRR